MKTSGKHHFVSVDEYISTFPEIVRMQLQELRTIIREAAPHSEESISYNMPAYRQHGTLVYFAGYKNHIGFYPTGSGMESFQKELAPYQTGKGTAQFPLGKPLPAELISRIVTHKVSQNLGKSKAKTSKSLVTKGLKKQQRPV